MPERRPTGPIGRLRGNRAGNEVQKKCDTPVPGQQIIVRAASGVLVSVTWPARPALQVGQRAFIEGSGEGARVVPQ